MTDNIYKDKLSMMNDGRYSSTNTRVVPYSLCNYGETIPVKRSNFWKEDIKTQNKYTNLFTQGNTSTVCELQKSIIDYNQMQEAKYGKPKTALNGRCEYK